LAGEVGNARQLKWYDGKGNRRGSTRLLSCASGPAREGHCYKHVQAAIDQYAEKALGDRDYFLNRPYGVG
jgi:hypothetical protein